jgi:hypothetical protein
MPLRLAVVIISSPAHPPPAGHDPLVTFTIRV